MKSARFFVLVAVLAASPAFAQSSEIELTRSIIQTERKMIVADNMPLSEEESGAFWPVYNEFQEAIRRVNDRRAELILNLAKEFETLSGERAQEMVKGYLDIEEQRIQVQRKFIGKFNKVLPAKKVARFFQLENKLNAVINYELAAAIPLIRSDVAAPPQ